jgi:hypothetical protein
MRVRFFGDVDFIKDDDKRGGLALVGYTKGVPMGSSLSKAPSGKVPSFLVYVLCDPISANLDRIQIIKRRRDAQGNEQEKVDDVARPGDR